MRQELLRCPCGSEELRYEPFPLCDCGQPCCSECRAVCEYCGHEGCEQCMVNTVDGSVCKDGDCADELKGLEDRRDAIGPVLA